MINPLDRYYNFKCIQCNNIFCAEHFEKHAQKYQGKQFYEIGSKITEYDKDYFLSECIVCISLKEIEEKRNMK